MTEQNDLDAELLAFERSFDTSHEDKAVSTRGQFLRDFPLNRLKDLTLDDYVIGKGTASFCTHVEAKTREWATIQGSTAIKFGIYFGKTKSEQELKYRFSKKFGNKKQAAFLAVKEALLTLVADGKKKKFADIDKNPLSQLFKAKILSLYYPDIYLNVCSADHLEILASELGLQECSFSSEYQHRLLVDKSGNSITEKWSNPKYMEYLYAKYINGDLNSPSVKEIKAPRKKANRRVNFEDISENRDEIGKKSEKYALEWEVNRLIGLGLQSLAKLIEDRRDRPSFGYDFMSYSSPDRQRFIEVKSVGKDKKNGGYRIFLSDNERTVSKSQDHAEEYYFYLVFYSSDGEPVEVLSMKSSDLYSIGEINPCAYLVRFDRDK